MNNKKGISLIVLIITIIIILILTGATILSFSNNNTINDANEAVKASNINSMNSAITMWMGQVMGDNLKAFEIINNPTATAGIQIKVAGEEAYVTAIDATTGLVTTSADAATAKLFAINTIPGLENYSATTTVVISGGKVTDYAD